MQTTTLPRPEARHVKHRQYAAYAFMLLLASIAAFVGYRTVNSAQVIYHKAESLFSNGAFAQAIPLYETVLDARLKKGKPLQRLFEANLRQGRGAEAVAAFDRLADRLKNTQDVVALANIFESQGRWQEAVDVFRRYETLWSESPPAMMHLADLYRNAADFDSAQREYRRALAKAPASLYARFRLAEVLAWSKRYDESIEMLRSILADDPDHRLTRLFLARVLSWNDRPGEAIIEYQKVLGERQ